MKAGEFTRTGQVFCGENFGIGRREEGGGFVVSLFRAFAGGSWLSSGDC